nr:integrase, catalytic region, zinc finger, CCHC-type, peptidase aspartic, catalytic [Tanacetum cinerariifolium]
MISELGDTNREVPVNETFYEQTNDKLSEKELKPVEADNQAIQTILLGFDIRIQEKKAKLFNEWERFTSTDAKSIESYYHRFLKLMIDFKRNKHFPKRISNPTTAINMAPVLMAKAFKLNYSSNQPQQENFIKPIQHADCSTGYEYGSRQIDADGWRYGGNQFRQYAGDNNSNGNGNVVEAQTEANAIGNNADLDKIEEVNANCILMVNLQQASTSGTQTDKASVYDLNGSDEVHKFDNCYDNEIFNMFTQEEQYTKLLEPSLEPHQVQRNDSNIISDASSVEQDRGTVDQHPLTVKETRTYFESLYNNLAIKVEKDITKCTSGNTQFCKQSILRKPPSSSKPKLYAVTPLPKSKGLPNIDETHALSKPVTSNSVPTPQESNVVKNNNVIQICLWCVDSGCSKHMIGNLKLLINFVWKFLGTVRFGNDHVVAILGFSDLQWGNILITRVNFVEVLRHNLFSVGQFCDSDLERLHLIYMDLCGPMRIASLNGKRALCYLKNDREDIGKLGAKGDVGFFIGYSVDTCAYRVYNRRTKKIMQKMNVAFNELSAMAYKVYSVICSTNNLNGENQVVSKSSAVTTADASNKRQQQQDLTSSTSTLALTIIVDGNFDL